MKWEEIVESVIRCMMHVFTFWCTTKWKWTNPVFQICSHDSTSSVVLRLCVVKAWFIAIIDTERSVGVKRTKTLNAFTHYITFYNNILTCIGIPFNNCIAFPRYLENTLLWYLKLSSKEADKYHHIKMSFSQLTNILAFSVWSLLFIEHCFQCFWTQCQNRR